MGCLRSRTKARGSLPGARSRRRRRRPAARRLRAARRRRRRRLRPWLQPVGRRTALSHPAAPRVRIKWRGGAGGGEKLPRPRPGPAPPRWPGAPRCRVPRGLRPAMRVLKVWGFGSGRFSFYRFSLVGF